MIRRSDSPADCSSTPDAPAAQASAATRSAARSSFTITSKHAAVLAVLLLLASTPGCYLAHVAQGQLRLLRAERPIEEVVRDPATPDELRASLTTLQDARRYARDLGLEVGDQYTSYVDWPGDRIVTIVATSRPGEVTPAGFWFPFLGRLPYKGYFDPARADSEADRWRRRGLDTCIAPVPAYSTLGWMADPITAPMLAYGEGAAVETVFHELVHATVYLKDHAAFNESVASFVGEEASVAFYASRSAPERAQSRRAEIEEQRQLDAALMALRDDVAALYARMPPGPERDAARAALDADARAAVAALPLETRDADFLADALRLNDACLALIATYGSDQPRFEAVLADLGGDLAAFVARLRAAADSADPVAALLGPLPDATQPPAPMPAP